MPSNDNICPKRHKTVVTEIWTMWVILIARVKVKKARELRQSTIPVTTPACLTDWWCFLNPQQVMTAVVLRTNLGITLSCWITSKSCRCICLKQRNSRRNIRWKRMLLTEWWHKCQAQTITGPTTLRSRPASASCELVASLSHKCHCSIMIHKFKKEVTIFAKPTSPPAWEKTCWAVVAHPATRSTNVSRTLDYGEELLSRASNRNIR